MSTPMDTESRPETSSGHHPNQSNNDTPNTPNPSSNSQPASGSHGASQIRSRITVVCAECKRLKLRCDRRTPCGSCLKRDTVNRCLYSAAAAEKIDVQSLHNRVLILEAALSQIGSGRGPGGPGSLPGSTGRHGSGIAIHDSGPPAMIAIGNSGSSLALALDDVSQLWLDHLDVSRDLGSFATSGNPGAGALELPPATDPAFSATASPADFLPKTANSAHSPHHGGANRSSPTPASPHSSTQSYGGGPLFLTPLTERAVTPALLQLLPHPQTEAPALLHILEHAMCMHPCFNFPHFRQRVEGLGQLRIQYPSAPASPSSSSSSGNNQVPFADLPPAQRPTMSFFAASAAGFALAAQASIANIKHASLPVPAVPPPSTNAAGSPPSVAMKTEPASGSETNLLAATNALLAAPTTCSPDALFAISTQGLAAFESTSHYDLDYLIAMILQILFLLHDGKAKIVHVLYPMVGKMVNVAQMMGLGTDPDEYPNQFSLFEAETRRRIWWDVYYYDLFVSDYMGLPPSLADFPFSTQLPADVDEHSFSPSSSALPIHMQDDHRTGSSAYFIQKCRLAQLVKDMKKRTIRDQQNGDLSVESATTYEGEVAQWLTDLPAAFKLQMDIDALPTGPPTGPSVHAPPEGANVNKQGFDMSCMTGRISGNFVPPGVSPLQVAQQCELTIVANRLIIKMFSPFLKRLHSSDVTPNPNNPTSLNSAYTLPSAASSISSGSGGQARKPPHQAVLATINAAHTIISATRVMHAVWTQHCPAAFQYYSFARSVFDAAVIAAHAVIDSPNAVYARAALDDVRFALEVMRDPAVNATGRGPIGGSLPEGTPSESVRIVELLKTKAEEARAGQGAKKWEAGTKRKHEDIEIQHIQPGFQLPFVGGAAAMPANFMASPPSAGGMILVPSGAVSNASGHSAVSRQKFNDGASNASSKYQRPTPYPAAAVRARPQKDQAGRRGSASTGSIPGTGRLTMTTSNNAPSNAGGSPSSLRMQTNVASQSQPPSSQQGPGQNKPLPPQQQHQPAAAQTPHPVVPSMGGPPPRQQQQQHQQPQPQDMDYSGGMAGYSNTEETPLTGLSQFAPHHHLQNSNFDSQSMGPPSAHPHHSHSRQQTQYSSGTPTSQFGQESPMHNNGMFNSPPVGHAPPAPTPTNGGMPGLVFPSVSPPNPGALNGSAPGSGTATPGGNQYFLQHQQTQGPGGYDMSMMGLGMGSMPGTPHTTAPDFGLPMVSEDVGVGLKASMGGQRLSISNGSGPGVQQQQRWQTNPEWQPFDSYYGPS